MSDNLPVMRARTNTTTAIQPASENDAQLSVELRYAHTIATKGGDACPKQYRGNDGAVLLAMHWGAKRGLDPLTAMQSVSFVQGRPVIDATALRALARQSGYRVTVEDASPVHAVVAVFENGELIGKAEFTIEDARAAGLTDKDNWRHYAEDMLVARATTRAVRRFAAEVMVGFSVPEEIVGAGDSGFSVDTVNVQDDPAPTLVAGSGEVDNDGTGNPAVGPVDPEPVPDEPVVSQAEATRRINMRGEIGLLIDQLDTEQKGRLRDWMKTKGWVLNKADSTDLADVQAYITAMIPEDSIPDAQLVGEE